MKRSIISVLATKLTFRSSIRLAVLSLLFVTVSLFQTIEGWGDYYAQAIYPLVAFILSSFSNIFTFSIGDLFISLSILALIIYPFYARKRGKRWCVILLREVEYLAWVYVWFYMAWGLNYSQSGLLKRLDIMPSQFSQELFMEFSEDYISKLNRSYQLMVESSDELPIWNTTTNRHILMNEVMDGYHSIATQFAVNRPFTKQSRVKDMMFSPLSSLVGVSGSMAPFFCEFTVNTDVLPLDYPATYAHEMAHLLGITSEAEANFYAYQVCTRSQNIDINFSGYNFILLYVLGNARSVLDKDQYTKLYESINPEIILIAQNDSKYWRDKYSPLLGDIQHYIYNIYLKSNRISSGTKNYSEVIRLLISVQDNTIVNRSQNSNLK